MLEFMILPLIRFLIRGFFDRLNSPQDCFKNKFCLNRKKGERSCSLPLGMALAIPHPFLRFLRICACGRGEGVSRSAERDNGALPP